MLAGATLVMLFNAATMLVPVAVGAFIERVIAPAFGGAVFSEIRQPLMLWTSALIGLYLIINLAYRFGGRLGWYGVQRSQYELAQAVLARLLHPRGGSGRQRPAGEALAVSTGDVHRACLVLYVAVYPPGDLVGLAVAVGVIIAVHPLLGAGVLVALPVTLVLMHLASRPLRRRSEREQAGIADAAALASDLVEGYRVLRGLHAQGGAAKRYRRTSREALRATLAARSAAAGFAGVSAGAAQLFAAAVAVAAAWLALCGEISAGRTRRPGARDSRRGDG